VNRLAVFGSVLRREDTPSSDLDLLVEFDPDHGVGFFELTRLERALSTVFGRRVELNTPSFLNGAFRFDLLSHAETIYAR
jgi:predicted nucleotidyltransferase